MSEHYNSLLKKKCRNQEQQHHHTTDVLPPVVPKVPKKKDPNAVPQISVLFILACRSDDTVSCPAAETNRESGRVRYDEVW